MYNPIWQKSGSNLAGFFWLWVSREIAVKISARVQSSDVLIWLENLLPDSLTWLLAEGLSSSACSLSIVCS